MKRLMFMIVLAAMLLAACAPAPAAPATNTPAPVGTEAPTQAPAETPVGSPAPTAELPETGPIPVDLPPAQVKSIEALAAELGISTEEIKLVEIQDVEWPNGCLGVQRMGVMCTQVITPGFRVILEANGVQYEYHTNADASVIIPAGLGAVGGEDAGAKAAIDLLVKSLSLAADQVKVVSNSAVDWPDSCLGVALPGQMCAQVVTPGRSIVLEANGVQYEFHTNRDASQVVPGGLSLSWHREGGIAGFCDDLSVFLPGSAYAATCGAQPKAENGSLADLLTQEELAQFNGWVKQFGQVDISIKDPASADAMTTTLLFKGQGTAQPTDAEKQAMIDFAQNLYGKLIQP